jgi:peptide/nickel transport system permease protein
MGRYLLRRALLAVPTLLLVSLLVIFLVRLLPGDAVDVLVAGGDVQAGEQALAELVDRYLAADGIDPAAATVDQRAAAERALIDGRLRRDGVDPLAATPVQRTVARGALALDAYRDALRARIGLDRPYLAHWWDWLTSLLRGDLGESLRDGRPVGAEVRRRLVPTLELGLAAFAIALGAGVTGGVVAALHRGRWPDVVARAAAVAGLALPTFLAATLLIAALDRWAGYSFPLVYREAWDAPGTNLQMVLAPALILGLGIAGQLARVTRAQVIDALGQDHVRAARARGLAPRTVVLRHALRTALLPVVTLAGLQVPLIVGGSLVLEQVFGIPGVASYLLEAVAQRDYPAIIAVNMLAALAILLANIAVDLSYALLDPRVGGAP